MDRQTESETERMVGGENFLKVLLTKLKASYVSPKIKLSLCISEFD